MHRIRIPAGQWVPIDLWLLATEHAADITRPEYHSIAPRLVAVEQRAARRRNRRPSRKRKAVPA